MLYIIEVWRGLEIVVKAHVVGTEEQARETYQKIYDVQSEDIDGGNVYLYQQMQDEIILLEGIDDC